MTAARFDDSKVQFGDAKKTSKLPALVAAMLDEFLDAPMPERQARKSSAAPMRPEDWPREFTKHLNAGELDAVMDLYDDNAQFIGCGGT